MTRYAPEHKAKTRQRLLDAARALFREEGFDAVSIDRLMKAAGLTRGGFYAHFDSKESLVQEVLAQDSGLIEKLQMTDAPSEAVTLFGEYLSEGEREGRMQCPLVAHAIDAHRGGQRRRDLYFDQIDGLQESFRKFAVGDYEATLLTVITVGAALLSTVATDALQADRIERVARKAIQENLSPNHKPVKK